MDWTQMDMTQKLDNLNERLLALEKPPVKESKPEPKSKGKPHGKRS